MLLTDYDWDVAYASDGGSLVRTFYLPLLRCATHYARGVGYFSSSSLVVAAQGFSALFTRARQGLIERPSVRLLTSAHLMRDDQLALYRQEELAEVVAAALRGTLVVPPDLLATERIRMLAWLLREGYVEIRIAVPVRPEALYHPKVGIVTDQAGNRLSFNGSVNESAQGWEVNIENFHVFTSWRPGEARHLEADVRRFESHWAGTVDGMRVVPLPEALRAQILEWVPAEAAWEPQVEPAMDAEPDREPVIHGVAVDHQRETWQDELAAASKNLLRELDASRVAVAALANTPVTAWPHQVAVLRETLKTLPVRRVLADEVGLGKTIEVALILRALALRGEARTVLFAVPAGLMPQWQDQLWTKGGYEIPYYDKGLLHYPDGTTEPVQTDNPLDGRLPAWLILSKTLLGRRDHRRWIDESITWDVVVVDEAHNLRRQAPENVKRPKFNELLKAFLRLRQTGKVRHQLLLTATPMQLHPIELYDLLQVLGIEGPWADEAFFRRYYTALQEVQAGNEHHVGLLLDAMAKTFDAYGLRLHPTVGKTLGKEKESDLGIAVRAPELWRSGPGSRSRLTASDLVYVAATHTPLQAFMSRHTRALLKHYYEVGLTKDPLPIRRVKDVVVPMEPQERRIYRALERYFVSVYKNDELTRKGLGFMKTLYLRRLTSSVTAAERSLERRLRRLWQQGEEQFELTEVEAVGGDPETLGVPPAAEPVRAEEVATIRGLLDDLARAGVDSKYQQLHRDLQELLLEYPSAIVFTQYTDTMDDLRDRLVRVFGTRLACYSGRGGEHWDGRQWVPLAKTELLDLFRTGETFRILLCTDAASEGFDLQSCSVLINYDMPWNPMRVEQRIGRIDRIGQQSPEIHIHNYYYEDSVDQLVYQALRDRLNVFATAVGPLQPILGRVEELIESALVTAAGDDRRTRIVTEVERFQRERERLEIAERTLEFLHAAEELTVPPVERVRSLVADWLQCYQRVTGILGRVGDEVVPGVTAVSTGRATRLVTADPAVYQRWRPAGVGWFGLEQPAFRQLIDLWASYLSRP